MAYEKSQEFDSSRTTSKPDGMRNLEWDCAGALRSESRKGPPKSSSRKSAPGNHRDASRAAGNTEVDCVFGIRTDALASIDSEFPTPYVVHTRVI